MATPIPFLPPRGGLSSSNAGSVLALDRNTLANVGRSLQSLQAQTRSLEAAARRTNEQAVKVLSRYAKSNLKTAVDTRGREQLGTDNLINLAGDHQQNSSWTVNGFHFFDPSVVNQSPGRAKQYWRAIELGSRHSVGRRAPVTFYRGGRAVPPGESRTDLGRQSPAGGTTKGGRQKAPASIYILRAIPAYHYIRDASNRFRSEDQYSRLFEAEIARTSKSLSRALKRGGPGYGR